jgi:O-antigen/teichoic acid export membrane protein
LWRLLPTDPQRRVAFRAAELRAAGRFAGGLVAIMALSVMVTQLDRVVISAMLPLAELGYFSLAMSVAAGMGRMIQPMFNALYPRYSRLVSLGQKDSLIPLYHLSNQCLAVVVAAVAAVLMVFGRDVLYLWTGDAAMAAKLALPLSILVAGTALNGLMNLPYALQLAHGWTRLAVGTNLVALILGIPFCIWAVEHHGIVGAACLWLFINLAFVAVGIPVMHRRLLRGEMVRWYVADMLPPAVAAAAVALLAGWLLPALSRSLEGIIQLAMVSGATLLSAAVAAPLVRDTVWQQLAEWFASRP